MKSSRLSLFIQMGLISFALIVTELSSSSIAQEIQYFCEHHNGSFKTFFRGTKGKVPIIDWVREDYDNLTPEQRCKQVSQKLQTHYEARMLRYLRTKKSVDGQSVICATYQKDEDCDQTNTLLTIPSDVDSDEYLNKLLNIYDLTSRRESLRLNDKLSIFYQGETYIDLEAVIKVIQSESSI